MTKEEPFGYEVEEETHAVPKEELFIRGEEVVAAMAKAMSSVVEKKETYVQDIEDMDDTFGMFSSTLVEWNDE